MKAKWGGCIYRDLDTLGTGGTARRDEADGFQKDTYVSTHTAMSQPHEIG